MQRNLQHLLLKIVLKRVFIILLLFKEWMVGIQNWSSIVDISLSYQMDSEIESTISGYSTDSMRSYRIFVEFIVFLFINSYLIQISHILLLFKKKKTK